MENKIVTDKWKVCILGDVCELIRGVSFKPSDVVYKEKSGYIPILRAGNIGNRLDLDNDLIWIPKHLVSNQQILRPNDITICMSSGSPLVVGKNAILDQEWRGSVGAFCGIIRGNNANISQYLSYWLRSSTYLEWRNTQARGANINNLRFSEFSKLSFPLPPLPEQKRIAAILKEQLAAVEQARKASEARLEAARALSAAYLKEVFENKDAVRWPRKRFGNVANLVRGRFSHRPRNDPRFYGGDYPWIQTSKVETSGKYITSYESTLNDKGLAVSKLFPKGTLVMTIAATIGAVGILSFDTCMPDSLVAVIPNEQEAETEYLYYLLTHIRKNMQSLAPRMAQANLKLELINPIEIPIPSLYIQGRVISYLNQKIDEAKNIENLLFEEYLAINSFPTSILHKAFSERL